MKIAELRVGGASIRPGPGLTIAQAPAGPVEITPDGPSAAPREAFVRPGLARDLLRLRRLEREVREELGLYRRDVLAAWPSDEEIRAAEERAKAPAGAEDRNAFEQRWATAALTAGRAQEKQDEVAAARRARPWRLGGIWFSLLLLGGVIAGAIALKNTCVLGAIPIPVILAAYGILRLREARGLDDEAVRSIDSLTRTLAEFGLGHIPASNPEAAYQELVKYRDRKLVELAAPPAPAGPTVDELRAREAEARRLSQLPRREELARLVAERETREAEIASIRAAAGDVTDDAADLAAQLAAARRAFGAAPGFLVVDDSRGELDPSALAAWLAEGWQVVYMTANADAAELWSARAGRPVERFGGG